MTYNLTGGVFSLDPSSEDAKQTTSVSLYSDLAGMVSVSVTTVPFSLIEPLMMSGKCLKEVPFTLQLISGSGE